MCDYTVWHLLILFISNPAVSLHYGRMFEAVVTFLYSSGLILYIGVCYFVALCLLCEISEWVWCTAALYNRGSIFRHTYYFARCYVRDLREGHRSIPHFLQAYLLACVLWSSYLCIIAESLQWATISLFVVRLILRGRHYGDYCLPASMWTVVLCGLSRVRS